ncbi:MAG: hypothetical protein M1819_006560 [Sarea resinae]|nr:MAG: hypothetical protein M1819_006560 [Sarea resinae]
MTAVSSSNTTPLNRKRKAEDEAYPSRHGSHDSNSSGDNDDRMSASPSTSPAISSRSLPHPMGHRQIKRARPNVFGRPLTLPRLLETLDAEAMRTVLKSICERHPDIGAEVVSTAPAPSVSSALRVMGDYEAALRASFPFGGNAGSDYAFNRIRQALMDLLDALTDFTPHFLPPNETQASKSLEYLDGATDIIHRLPAFNSFQNNLPKNAAYEEISKAWVRVIEEAAKKGAGIQLQYGGWDQKLAKHNEQSQGKMQSPLDELQSRLGWMHGNAPGGASGVNGGGGSGLGDMGSIRQQLLSGTYGTNLPVRVGPW